MSVIFDTTFEDNHLYQYPVTNGFHAVYIDGGEIEVNTYAKKGGSYGCQITPAIYSKTCGLQYTEPLTRFRQRFWVHPNTLSLTENKSMYLARNYHSDSSRIMYAIALKNEGGDLNIWTALADNSQTLTAYSGNVVISKTAWTMVETDWKAGTPGFLNLYINGTYQKALSANNSNNTIIYPALGVPHYHSAAISGAFYIDDWKANDDGSSIGA